jgi:hypothetical protein
VEAIVSGFKPGSNGHADLVGAVEFSIRQSDGSSVPVAWVTGWTDAERKRMTQLDANGKVILSSPYMGRRAVIEGYDFSAKSRRIRHAKIQRWVAA